MNIGISRLLGPSPLGLFALILNAVQSFELFTKLGLDYSLSLSLTSYPCNQPTPEGIVTKKRVIQKGLLLLLISVVFGSAIFWLWIGPGDNYLPETLGQSRNLIVIYLIVICLLESLSSFFWDIIISLADTRLFSLRAAIVSPSKLLAFLVGFLLDGLTGGLVFFMFCSFIVLLLLIGRLPKGSLNIRSININFGDYFTILKSGSGLYFVNAISALVYLPLWSDLALNAGFSDLGYLRVGQIMVQAFALIPGSLLPAFFLKLRLEPADNMISNKLLQITWAFSLFAFTCYSLFGEPLTLILFGSAFVNSFSVGQILILTTVVDSIVQVLHTPYLAKQQVRFFLIAQLTPLAFVFLFGIKAVNTYSLMGFLAVKVIASLIPLLLYLLKDACSRDKFFRAYDLLLITLSIAIFCFIPPSTLFLIPFYCTVLVFSSAKLLAVAKGNMIGS